MFVKLDFEVIFKFFDLLKPEISDPDFYYREDRRRGYIGNDYGEDDDEVDYSKMYQEEEDVNLFVSKIHTSKTVFEYIFLQARRPGHDKRFRTIGESIILGAAAVATAGDKNTPQLVRNTSHAKPRIFENYIESHENNTHTVGLAEVLEDSCKFKSNFSRL